MKVVLVGAELEENLSIRYLMGALEAGGHKVRFVPFNSADDLEGTCRKVVRSGADLVGFSMVFTLRARQFATLIARCREGGFRGLMVAGGSFAALHAHELLRDLPALDGIALGEGETPLRALADAGSFEGIPGWVWRDPTGEARHNTPAPPQELDALPMPVRLRPHGRILDVPFVNILASRGCAHDCAFCSIRAWHRFNGGPALRLRSVEAVADEMAALYRSGVRLFNFHDDNFLPPSREAARKRVQDLAGALRRRRLGRIGLAIKARPDEVEPESLATLVEMGLFRIFLGVENGSDQGLVRLGKRLTTADTDRALALLESHDLHVAFNLLLQDPGSRLEDMSAHIAFLRAHPTHPMNVCRTEVFTGTPLHRMLEAEGRLLMNYWGWDYRMQDERAQRLMEIWHPAFQGRNRPMRCLHHRAMNVDYERQILRHFGTVPPELDRAIREWLTAVNLNTADHLEWAMEAARHASCEQEAARAREELRRRVQADNLRLDMEGVELLLAIRQNAHSMMEEAHVPRRRKLASLGLVAALLLGEGTAVLAGPPSDPSPAKQLSPKPLPPALMACLHQYSTSMKEKEIVRQFFWFSRELGHRHPSLGERMIVEIRQDQTENPLWVGFQLGEWKDSPWPLTAEARVGVRQMLEDMVKQKKSRQEQTLRQLRLYGTSILPELEAFRVHHPEQGHAVEGLIQEIQTLMSFREKLNTWGPNLFPPLPEELRGKVVHLSFHLVITETNSIVCEIASVPPDPPKPGETVFDERQLSDLPIR